MGTFRSKKRVSLYDKIKNEIDSIVEQSFLQPPIPSAIKPAVPEFERRPRELMTKPIERAPHTAFHTVSQRLAAQLELSKLKYDDIRKAEIEKRKMSEGLISQKSKNIKKINLIKMESDDLLDVIDVNEVKKPRPKKTPEAYLVPRNASASASLHRYQRHNLPLRTLRSDASNATRKTNSSGASLAVVGRRKSDSGVKTLKEIKKENKKTEKEKEKTEKEKDTVKEIEKEKDSEIEMEVEVEVEREKEKDKEEIKETEKESKGLDRKQSSKASLSQSLKTKKINSNFRPLKAIDLSVPHSASHTSLSAAKYEVQKKPTELILSKSKTSNVTSSTSIAQARPIVYGYGHARPTRQQMFERYSSSNYDRKSPGMSGELLRMHDVLDKSHNLFHKTNKKFQQIDFGSLPYRIRDMNLFDRNMESKKIGVDTCHTCPKSVQGPMCIPEVRDYVTICDELDSGIKRILTKDKPTATRFYNTFLR